MTPKERLQLFLAAMEAWEIWNNAENRKPEYHGEYREKQTLESKERLLAIFTDFLTRRALDKNRTFRLYALSFSRPPEFAQEIEAEFEEKGRHSYIYTQHKRGAGFYSRRKYDLVREDEEWKIDAIFSWTEYKQKWQKIHV